MSLLHVLFAFVMHSFLRQPISVDIPDVEFDSVVLRNVVQSSPPIQVCNDGWVSALLWAVESSESELTALLEALGVGTPESGEASALTVDETPILPNNKEGIINQATCKTARFKRSVERSNNKGDKGVGARHSTQLGKVLSSLTNQVGEVLSNILAESGILAGEIAKKLAMKNSNNEKLPKGLNTIDSSGKHVTRKLADEPAAASDIKSKIPKKLLMFLTSRTMVGLLHELFGANRVVPNDDDVFDFVPKTVYLGKPEGNLFSTACKRLAKAKRIEPVPEWVQCTFQNVFSAAMACRDTSILPKDHCKKVKTGPAWLPNMCSPEFGPYAGQLVNMNGFVNIHLTDLNPSQSNPLPNQIPSSIFNDDGFSLLLLFRSTHEAATQTFSRTFCNHSHPVMDIIPGWHVTKVIGTTEAGERSGYNLNIDVVPLVFISRPRVAVGEFGFCRTILTIRGTMTQFEWKLNLLSTQFPMPGLPGVLAHSGFLDISSSLFPSVDSYIMNMFDDCSKVEIIITGHSLGAGVGQLLSLHLANKFPFPQSTVSLAAFGTPNVLNLNGTKLFSETVNGRIVNFDLDPVSQAPCTTDLMPDGWPSCDNNIAGFHPPFGHNDFYSKSPGVIELPKESVSDYFDLPDSWGRIDFQGLYSPLALNVSASLTFPDSTQFAVFHENGYRCRLSKFCASPSDDLWHCGRGVVEPIEFSKVFNL